jgi:hypothetical protein
MDSKENTCNADLINSENTRSSELLRSFGIGEPGGGYTGRSLAITAITPQIDEEDGKPFVQVIMNNPLRVYRLEIKQASTMANDLIEAVSVCVRATR